MLGLHDALDLGAPVIRGIELLLQVLLVEGGTLLSMLPRDIARYIIAPMVISPYRVVTMDNDTNIVFSDGEDCFCRGFFIGKHVIKCARTQVGWATLDDYGDILFHGITGSYGGRRGVEAGTFIGEFIVAPTWDEGGLLLRIRPMPYFPEPVPPFAEMRRVRLPGLRWQIAYYDEDHSSSHDVDVTLVLWDGARELLLYRQLDERVEFLYKLLPSTAVAVVGRLGEYFALYPWGEVQRFDFSAFFDCKVESRDGYSVMYNPKLCKVIHVVLDSRTTLLAKLPLDLRRHVLVPMILYPYEIVGRAKNRYLLRDVRDDQCWIGGICLGKNIRVATRTTYGWIVQDDSAIYAVGAHGIYARYRITKRLLDTYWNYAAERCGDVVRYDYAEADHWCAGMGQNRDEWCDGQIPIEAPPEFDKVVLIIGHRTDIFYVILWDGGRRLWDGITQTRYSLPWTPVSFAEVTDENECLITAPWGEIAIISFFESLE